MKPLARVALLAWSASTALGSPATLLLHWDFERMDDRRITDRSGQGKHGRVRGEPRPEPGAVGSGLRFAQVADYLETDGPVVPAGDFTISLWIRCDDVEKQFFLGQYRYADPQRLDLAVREGAVRIQIDEIVDSPPRIAPGRWYHLAYVRSGENLTTYVDGQVAVSGRLPANVIQTENLMVGKIAVPKQDSFRFTGVLDELKIWAGPLTAAAVQREFARAGRR